MEHGCLGMANATTDGAADLCSDEVGSIPRRSPLPLDEVSPMVSGNGLRLSSAEQGIDGPSSWPRAPFGAMPRRIDGLRRPQL
jgi:hypothetical protein